MQRNSLNFCQGIKVVMKGILSITLILSLIFSCKKNDKELCDTYLTISSTNTPSSTTLSQGITSTVNSHGPDLCYKFAGMEITQQPTPSGPAFQFQYFIKVKGTVPCGSSICAQAIYNSTNSFSLAPTKIGTYYLHFYNQNQVFKTDTVIVN
jgi:hypothetical protein